MDADDSYVVRVTGLVNATGLFTWELCRGDGLQVLQRSTRSFPTRLEALFDSAQTTAALVLGALQNLPLA
jgi:hypothetical protein